MRLALVLLAALAACRPIGRGPVPPPSNVSRSVDPPSAAERAGGPAIAPELYRDLALVKSFEGMHGAVSRHGLDAAARVFERVRWHGMSRATVAALLGEPTTRDPAGESWRYDLDHDRSSVFLKLRFVDGAVERVIRGDAEIQLGPAILE
jgi:hypothetical protein